MTDTQPDSQPDSQQPDNQNISPKLLEALVCPATGGRLEYDAAKAELVSKTAMLAYPIRSGIPIMLIDEARKIEG
jgi:hypothetical protein